MSEKTEAPKRDKYGFVPIGYFISGFCLSLSLLLYTEEAYNTVAFSEWRAIPIWIWSGAVAGGFFGNVVNRVTGKKP